MSSLSLLVCAIAVLGLAPIVRADVVTDWNNALLDAIRVDRSAPPRAARAMAIVHVAVFDAVNAYRNRYESYHCTPNTERLGSNRAAAAAAAHRALTTLFPAQAATFDAKLADSLERIADTVREHGVAWGQFCADEILALRAADHSSDVVPYTPGTDPGDWQPTTPAFAPALLPNWPTVTPWALISGMQFRAPGTPDLTSMEYADAFNEVKDLGRNTSTVRTAEQTDIALFWADGPGTATPPGHWNVIAQSLRRVKHASLVRKARVFALLNIAAADAAICAWDTKYAYNHWRPVTAIRAADSDGNDVTAADPTWTPLITTPPFPAYTSGHSTFSAAAATVLARILHNDDVHFDTISDGLPGVTRSFTTLSDTAAEAGQSRIYGGIHWQYDNQHALAAGRALGDFVVDTVLLPRR